MQKNIKQDLPIWLLGWFAQRLPPEQQIWADALLGELAQIPGIWERLIWTVSGICGLGKIWMRTRLENVFDGDRPLAVTLIALYHAILSCIIVAVLVWQLPRMRTPWTEAFFPVLMSLFVALIPGVIALGLWVLDDAARLMAIILSLLHALGNGALISTHHLGWTGRPVGRIVLDLVMIGILLLPSIRGAFRPLPVDLRLRS